MQSKKPLTEASQEKIEKVSDEVLSRAAEETNIKEAPSGFTSLVPEVETPPETEPAPKGVEAAKPVVETPPLPSPVVPPVSPPEEKLIDGMTNAERSKLGRKVEYLEGVIQSLIQAQAKPHTETIKGPKKEFQIPTTWEEMKEIKAEMDLQEQSEQAEKLEKYQAKYKESFYQIPVAMGQAFDSEIHAAIVAEMEQRDSPFNRIFNINDPMTDLRVNYSGAQAHVLRQKLKEASPTKVGPPRNPLVGKPPIVPLGVSGTPRVEKRDVETAPLDEHAKRFLSVQGLTQEWAEKALKEEDKVGRK